MKILNRIYSPKSSHFHWFILSVLLVSYSLYDYIEHISRDDIFYEQPIRWALFSFASVFTMIMVAFLSSLLMEKFLPELLASTVGASLAILIHLTVAGPLWDKLFWHGDLYFVNIMTPVLFGTGLYLLYRAVFYSFNAIFNKIK